MVTNKHGTEIEIGMYVYDTAGTCEVLEIDEARHCCLVREIYWDEDGDPYPVGHNFLMTFGEIQKCD